MNPVLKVIYERKSIRAYKNSDIPEDIKDEIIKAAMKAPTAGNMMLYSIIEVTDQSIKDTLAKTCDNQPFIAKAPLVLLFLADYQRWYDYFINSEVPELCKRMNIEMRRPQEGDLFLACSDVIIAAQNAVIAAESLGVGSCYIGDIMENYEIHRELFDLPQYVFPIVLLCFGYPTEQQRERGQTRRFDKQFIVFKDKYRRLNKEEFNNMHKDLEERVFKVNNFSPGAQNIGQHFFLRKFNADFSKELNRSVREILQNWLHR
ncbi:MAG: nitroreductase family protein [Actinobacteria bacterium]|nr:nitroreductase family protein [Actinomycetota bacterium]